MGSRVEQWVVDSIEESVASIEVDGRRTVQIPLARLPKGVQQGDVLKATYDDVGPGKDPRLDIVVDREATRAAKQKSARQVRSTGRSPNDPAEIFSSKTSRP